MCSSTLSGVLVGFYALLISGIAVGAGVYNEVDLGYIHAHFLQFYTSALLISVLLSIYLFVRSRWASDDELAPAGNSGNCVLWNIVLLSWLVSNLNMFWKILLTSSCSGYVMYDFFMGRELNPRIKDFDIKFFCEMRPGLIGWVGPKV